MDLSVASLFGYRAGNIRISNKAWSKLERAERQVEQSSNAESSTNPKDSSVSETEIPSPSVLRDDVKPYGGDPAKMTLEARVAKLEAALEAIRRALGGL
jgi:hypothetical protein